MNSFHFRNFYLFLLFYYFLLTFTIIGNIFKSSDSRNLRIFFLRFRLSPFCNPAGNYMLRVNNRNTRTRCKICSKLKNTPERRHWHRSGVFSINSEHISHLNVVFILLTLLSWKIPAGKYRN